MRRLLVLPVLGALSLLGHASAPETRRLPQPRSYDSHDYYVLEVRDGAHSLSVREALARELDVELVEQVGELRGHWLVRALKDTDGEGLEKRGEARDRVMERYEKLLTRQSSSLSPRSPHIAALSSLTPQTPRQRYKRVPLPLPDAPSSPPPPPVARAAVPVMAEWERVADLLDIRDPIFGEQWHLINDRMPEHSINVSGVWLDGLKGAGVPVCIVDDGLDMHSDDLAPNFFPEGSWDFNDHVPLPEPRLSDDQHGTRCAGEVAAARNDVCGVGVAYEAPISGVRILSAPISDADEAAALNFAFQQNQIYSCSWGPPDDGKSMEGPSRLIEKAVLNGVQNGRGGKGSIYVFASGNGGASDDQCNFDGYTNSIYSITVSAISRAGVHPYYSEPCAANLVVTYSSGSGDNIHTTDVGKDKCTDRHGGTSAAAPIAAGIFALVLEARPELTWRDLQYLCIHTAIPVNTDEAEWESTSSGRLYNYKYGYGKLDTYTIVAAAKAHALVKPQAWVEGEERPEESEEGTPIPQDGAWIESTWTVDAARLKKDNFERLEHVTTRVWINHQRRGDVEVELVSPNGVTSTLAKPRRFDASKEGFVGWRFMSTKHWDENPVGTWTIRVRDSAHPDKTGSFLGWSISLWGESIDPELAVPYTFPEDRVAEPAPSSTAPTPSPTPDPPLVHSSSATTTYQYARPTEHLPDDHGDAEHHPPFSSSSPDSTYSPTPDEGYIENESSLLRNQTWLVGAGVIVLAAGAVVGAFFWWRRRRAARLAGGDTATRGGYASLGAGDAGDDVSMSAMERGAGSGRTKELYDAFRLTDTDSEGEDGNETTRLHRPSLAGGAATPYRDDEEEEELASGSGRRDGGRYRDDEGGESGAASRQSGAPAAAGSAAQEGGGESGSASTGSSWADAGEALRQQ